jgi:hypothetical protein
MTMKHSRRMMGLSLLALAVFCGGAVPAGASEPASTHAASDPSLLGDGSDIAPGLEDAPVASSLATGSSGMLRAQVHSPAGCSGRTDYPDKSGQDVSVHAVMNCKRAVSRVETATVVYRERWNGLESVVAGSAARNSSSTSGTATPHKSCKGTGTFTYRAYSSHASLENGTIYRANTSNWQAPGKSRFAC